MASDLPINETSVQNTPLPFYDKMRDIHKLKWDIPCWGDVRK